MFFAEPYILVPAGLIVGFGEACFWPSAMLIVMHFAKSYSEQSKGRSSKTYVSKFLGLYYTGLNIAWVSSYAWVTVHAWVTVDTWERVYEIRSG